MTTKPEQLARDRAALQIVVAELVRRHDRMTAAQTLAAQAVALLEAEGGSPLAAQYLRKLAAEVERTARPGAPRH